MFPQVGYCQGMNFMVSIILEVMNHNEHLSFLIFVHFLNSKKLSVESVFMQGLPELELMNFTFDKLIQYFCRDLYEHLDELEMRTEYFTFKWCLTLYSCFLPVELTTHVFDLFILDGWPAIYEIGISLMNNFLGDKLKEMETMADVSQYFRDDMRMSMTYGEEKMREIVFGTHMLQLSSILPLLKENYYSRIAQEEGEQNTNTQNQNMVQEGEQEEQKTPIQTERIMME